MRGVLVTRPTKQATPFAIKLETLGYQPIIEPMLSVMATSCAPPQGPFDAVMITSANACDALSSGHASTAALLSLPCFCVGPVSGDAAQAAGFIKIVCGTGNGLDLGQLAANRLPRGSRILHIAAADVASAGRVYLIDQGFAVTVWEAYCIIEATTLSSNVMHKLSDGQITAMTFFSPQTAAVFKRLVTTLVLEACCNGASAIGLSEAVIRVIMPLPWRTLAAAAAPTENAVIMALQECCTVKR